MTFFRFRTNCRGNFAEVRVAVHADSGHKVAAKIIDKKKLMMSVSAGVKVSGIDRVGLVVFNMS